MIKDEKTAYLALGSNMGDPISYLQEAIRALSHTEGITLRNVSYVYETEPVGLKEQNNFFNLVVEIATTLSVEALLQNTQEIENNMGRVRTIINGPRTLDIDILFVGDNIIETNQLVIPHPRLWERGFVLIPLSDLIDDDTIMPGTALPLSEWLNRVKEKAGVEKCQHIIWDSESERFVNLKGLPNKS